MNDENRRNTSCHPDYLRHNMRSVALEELGDGPVVHPDFLEILQRRERVTSVAHGLDTQRAHLSDSMQRQDLDT